MKLFKLGKKKEGYKCVQYGMITHIKFDIDKIQFVCSFTKAIYPDDSPIEAAKRNAFWRDAEECVKNHRAFMIVGILKNECLNQIKTCSIFTQVCCSLMGMSNGICMYNADSSLIIEKNSYRNYMNIMKTALEHNEYYIPYENWINVNYVREEDGKIGAFTTGLNVFNKLEIELVHIEYEIEVMQKIIGAILFGLIIDNRTLESGQLIKLDEDIEIITKRQKVII